MTHPRTLVVRASLNELMQAYVARWGIAGGCHWGDDGDGHAPCPDCGPPKWRQDVGAWLHIRSELDMWCHRCKIEITRCRIEREVVESPRCVNELLELLGVPHD